MPTWLWFILWFVLAWLLPNQEMQAIAMILIGFFGIYRSCRLIGRRALLGGVVGIGFSFFFLLFGIWLFGGEEGVRSVIDTSNSISHLGWAGMGVGAAFIILLLNGLAKGA